MTDDIHIIPNNDLHEHIDSSDCPCKPTIEIVGAVLIYTHNAYDHREIIEAVEEWLCS